jgi:hypothetical protein
MEQALLLLGESITASYGKETLSGRRKYATELWRKTTISALTYNEGNVGYSATSSFSQRTEWPMADRFRFINELVVPTPEYANVLKMMVSSFLLQEKDARSKLSYFLNYVSEQLGNPASPVDLKRACTLFYANLSNLPVKWSVKIGVEGIWLLDDIVSAVGFSLRRPRPADFEHEESVSRAFPGIDGGYEQFPPAYLEASVEAKAFIEIQQLYIHWLNVLTFFRLGNVNYFRISSVADSVLPLGFSGSGNQQIHAKYRYQLGKCDEPALMRFYDSYSPKLKRVARPILPTTHKADELTISLERYRDAVGSSMRFEEEITRAITCLEALYLAEKVELRHRLGQRVAFVMGAFGYDSSIVYGEIAEAYEIRSSHLHGAEVSAKKAVDMADLPKSVLEYCRRSILVRLGGKNHWAKKSFLSEIDAALLDPKRAVSLRLKIQLSAHGEECISDYEI